MRINKLCLDKEKVTLERLHGREVFERVFALSCERINSKLSKQPAFQKSDVNLSIHWIMERCDEIVN